MAAEKELQFRIGLITKLKVGVMKISTELAEELLMTFTKFNV